MARWFCAATVQIIEDGGEYRGPDGVLYPATFPKADIPTLVPYVPNDMNAEGELCAARCMRHIDIDLQCTDAALRAELHSAVDAAQTPEAVREVTW